MEYIIIFFIFFFGLFVGSFLGVIIDRLPKGEDFIKGRSHCDHCHKLLGVADLFPVFSYIFLGGKCRYCKKPLSVYYPLLELITGLLFVLSFLHINSLNPLINTSFFIHLLFYLFIISVLIIIFFIDLKYGIIPFWLVVASVIISLLYFFLTNNAVLLNHFLAAIGGFLFFLSLFLITRGKGMGFGDVIFAFFMGFLLGLPNIVLGLYIAFLSGAIISLLLIWMKRKQLKGSTVPFGPFLVLGTVISLFWGDKLISLTIDVLQFTIK